MHMRLYQNILVASEWDPGVQNDIALQASGPDSSWSVQKSSSSVGCPRRPAYKSRPCCMY